MECDFEKAEGRYSIDMLRNRHEEMKSDLYRAIYSGDVVKAKETADMMAMVDIDRELIWSARNA